MTLEMVDYQLANGDVTISKKCLFYHPLGLIYGVLTKNILKTQFAKF